MIEIQEESFDDITKYQEITWKFNDENWYKI